MNQQTTARYAILTFAGMAGLAAAIIAGSAELALLSSPALLLVIFATINHRWPDIAITTTGPTRAVEGDQIDIMVAAQSRSGVPWLELELELPPDLEPVDGIRNAVLRVPAGRRVVVKFPVIVKRWGVSSPGRLHIVARDTLGMFVSSRVHPNSLVVRVHPRDGNRRSVVAPRKLRARVGSHRSTRHGDGTDFAEIRPWRIGDDNRSVNWRVSARKSEPWVTVRHPDESGDLVFLLDTFRNLGPDHNQLVQRAVRAAMSLAESNLSTHDRVGLLDIGRHIRWYRPRLGRLHQARIFDALLETQVEPGLRAPRIEQLPLHDLDAGTMIVVLTGLTDANMSRLPIELRQRGLEVAVVDCSVDDHVSKPNNRAEEYALRLWRVTIAQRRDELIRHGVSVVQWRADQPLELPIAALARRGVRR